MAKGSRGSRARRGSDMAGRAGSERSGRNVIGLPCDFGASLVAALRDGELSEDDIVTSKGGLNTNQIKKHFRHFAGGHNEKYGLIAAGDDLYKVATSLCQPPANRKQFTFPVGRDEFSNRDELTPADGDRVQQIWNGLGDVLCITVLHHPDKGLGVAWREMPRSFGPEWTRTQNQGISGHILGEGNQGRVTVRKTPSTSDHRNWEVGLYMNRGCTSFLGWHLKAFGGSGRIKHLTRDRGSTPRPSPDDEAE